MPRNTTIKEDFTFKFGDSWPPFSFNVKDELGVAASLSGASILMQIKISQDDEDALYTFTETNGFIIANGVASLDRFNISTVLPVGKYYYDIQVTLANGIVQTVIEGKINIKKD